MRRALGCGAALVLIAVPSPALAMAPAAPGPGPEPPPAASTASAAVVASLPYWYLDTGTGVVLANRSEITEASPWLYGIADNGAIVPQYPAAQAGAVAADLSRLRRAGLPIVPTIANVTGGAFAYQPIAGILHDVARTSQLISGIVALANANDFTGIDIDYEDLAAGDRAAFTSFAFQLGEALHAAHRTLSVTVFAKTSDDGDDPRDVGQDYIGLGQSADELRVMGYGEHWESSPPGPVAPVDWVTSVLAYAVTRVPPAKIVLGVPLYGMDWIGGHGTPISWARAIGLATAGHVAVTVDQPSQTPWFRYLDGAGQTHEVWFEDAASSTAKLTAARQAGVGVYLWMYGDADFGTWAALRNAGRSG
ncbi:MAG TPA: glycosyl hydrolase family 18 protein [Pseudonocardiaceae bacterium]|jgi:spore germination protein YaaH|nr:glycosyl hydrolase family 18 protein [Pseudonocardiaceae bacterium]